MQIKNLAIFGAFLGLLLLFGCTSTNNQYPNTASYSPPNYGNPPMVLLSAPNVTITGSGSTQSGNSTITSGVNGGSSQLYLITIGVDSTTVYPNVLMGSIDGGVLVNPPILENSFDYAVNCQPNQSLANITGNPIAINIPCISVGQHSFTVLDPSSALSTTINFTIGSG